MKFSWPLVIAVAPAPLLCWCFHRNDNLGLYGGYLDGLGYVWISKNIISGVASSASLQEALKTVYELRTWKGSMISQIAAVFLFFGGMDGDEALLLFNLFFLSLFLIYLFLTFSEFVPPWCAGAATALISTLSWIFSLSLILDTFLPFIAGVTMATFHLLRSEMFTKRSHSLYFGIAAALCACLRPVETTMILTIPLFVYLFGGGVIRKHRIRSGIVLLFPVMLLLIVGYAISSWKFDYPGGIYALLVIIPVLFLPLLLQRWCGYPQNLSIAYILFLVPATLWWLPYSGALVTWAEAGAGTNKLPPLFSARNLDSFFQNFLALGGLGFLLLICFVGARFIRMQLKFSTERRLVFLFFYLGVFLMAIGSAAPSRVINYPLMIFVFVLVISLILALKNIAAPISAAVVLFLFVGNQVWFLTSMMAGYDRTDSLVSLMKLAPITYNRDFLPGELNPAPIFLDRLRNLLSLNNERREWTRVGLVRANLEGGQARVSKMSYLHVARDEGFLSDYSELLVSEPLVFGCDKDVGCLKHRYSEIDYFMVEMGSKAHEFSRNFKQDKACRLTPVGTIDSIVVERTWVGYQVYRRDCNFK